MLNIRPYFPQLGSNVIIPQTVMSHGPRGAASSIYLIATRIQYSLRGRSIKYDTWHIHVLNLIGLIKVIEVISNLHFVKNLNLFPWVWFECCIANVILNMDMKLFAECRLKNLQLTTEVQSTQQSILSKKNHLRYYLRTAKIVPK